MTTAQARMRGIRGERDTIEVPPSRLRRLVPELAEALDEVSSVDHQSGGAASSRTPAGFDRPERGPARRCDT